MRSKKYFPILILIPFFIFFILFRFAPVIMTGVRSLFDIKNGEWLFNNFTGYSKIFTDLEFYKAIYNTLIIFLIYCLIKLPLIILISLLICSIGRSKKIYIKFMYLPMIVGMFAYGIIFRYMFTYDGIINSIMMTLFNTKINWLGNSLASKNILVFAMMWGSFGINVMMVSNIINKIPKEQLEYAKIEGPPWFTTLRKIIIPAIKPILISVIMLSLIETIGLIDVPMNLTQGGPEMSTVTLGYYIYKLAFEYSDFSYASTVSTILFISIILVITVKNIIKMRKEC